MDKTKVVIVVLAIGILMFAGFLSLGLVSPEQSSPFEDNPKLVPTASKATAQITVNILPEGERWKKIIFY